MIDRSSGSPFSVLVVEDDEGLRRLMAKRLAATGLGLDEAGTGRECLSRIADRAPDLLIVDYRLPDFSAAELVDELKNAGRSVPFLVVTGQGNERVAVEMMQRGARDYLVKDQRFLDQLPITVRRVLEQIESEAQLADARRARAQTEQRLRRIFENLGDQYFLYERDSQGYFTFVTPSVKLVLGYEVDEFLQHYAVFLPDHPVNAEAHRRTAASIRGELQPPYAVVVRHRDGTLRQLEVQEVPVFDQMGRVAIVEGTARDMTVELQQRETLRIQAAALESTVTPIVITDREGDIVWVNRAFCDSCGYAREEVIGRNPRLLKSGAQDDAFYRSLWQTLVEGGVWEGEVVNRRKDGTTYREAMTISPVHDELGAISHYVGIKRDITHERELEHHLQQAQRLEAVGTLAGGVAHDFNNLLTVINGFCELAMSAIGDEGAVKEALGEIRAAGERASALTSQLLAFSRRQIVRPRLIDPNELIAGMEKMLRRLLREDLMLVCALSEDAPAILIDPGQLEQVVMNLAVNARDAMPSGGILTLETRRVDGADHWPGDPLLEPGSYLLLEVRDTGVGMSAETVERIFDPFFTTKESGRGTGLGLAMVHGIVEQAGGRVRVVSMPGEGSRFQLLFPPGDQGGEAVAAPLRRDALRALEGRGELILVIEDDPPLLDLTSRILRSAGYRVVATSRGSQALEVVAARGLDIALVVSDVVMPGLSGPDLVQRIQQERPEIPALLVSGYTDAGGSSFANLPPGTPLLAKPFTRGELLAAVGERLRRPER